eukprot:6556850-Prymnesium_polylepis.2
MENFGRVPGAAPTDAEACVRCVHLQRRTKTLPRQHRIDCLLRSARRAIGRRYHRHARLAPVEGQKLHEC